MVYPEDDRNGSATPRRTSPGSARVDISAYLPPGISMRSTPTSRNRTNGRNRSNAQAPPIAASMSSSSYEPRSRSSSPSDDDAPPPPRLPPKRSSSPPTRSNGSIADVRSGGTDISAYLPGISMRPRTNPTAYQQPQQPGNGRKMSTASSRPPPSETGSLYNYEPRLRSASRSSDMPPPAMPPPQRPSPTISRRSSVATDVRAPSISASVSAPRDISAYLPGISLNTRATPLSYQQQSGRNTPHSYIPGSGRSTPFRPVSGRSTPTSAYSVEPRSRSASRSRDALPPSNELVQRSEQREERSEPKVERPKPKERSIPKEEKPRKPKEEKSKPKKEEKPPSRRPSATADNNGGDDPDGNQYEGDENEERGNWSNKMDFVLSCLGYAVGLGNVWRFPYLAYRNGGGAFLIPYAIMLFFAGLPLFLMEVSFGQYCSLGPISIWRCVPLMRGLGYCQMFTAMIVGIYYNVIIMYTLYYFFASFTSQLPWVGCQNAHNDVYCYDLYADCVDNAGIIANNGSCLRLDDLNTTTLSYYNVTSNLGGYNISLYRDPLDGQRELASEQYWKNGVLQEADTMNEPGGVIWQLALCLLLAWIIVLLCLIRGIKSSGKVVYFTATFPYIVLFILFIRGVTLPGAGNGIKFFVIPDFNRLSDPRVWRDAAIQIFFSLSAAGGGLVTLASYNKFHNNAYWDSMFVAIANCCTSVFAGFVIFSIVGFMAHELGQPVESVVTEGFGLAFIAYPAAVARMPVSPLWAVLFFGMLITLGLDSQFAIMENLVTAFVDEFPALRPRKTYVLVTACCIMFFLGFSCITHTGGYWVSHLDSYGAFFNYLVYALLECVALSWIYGVKRLQNDIRTMVGDKWVGHWTFMWWSTNWTSFTPALMMFVLIFNWLNWEEPSYNGPFPGWAVAVGWMITMCSLIWIPVYIIYEFFMEEGDFWTRWRLISTPEDIWGPALGKFRLEAWKVHHKNGTTMGGRLDIDGSGRKWDPGEIIYDEEEEEEVINDLNGATSNRV